MATIYTIELVSSWVNYDIETLEMMLQEAVEKIEMETSNEIKITVIDSSK